MMNYRLSPITTTCFRRRGGLDDGRSRGRRGERGARRTQISTQTPFFAMDTAAAAAATATIASSRQFGALLLLAVEHCLDGRTRADELTGVVVRRVSD